MFSDIRKITKILPTSPPTFKVSGLERSYYRAELAPTKESEVERQKTYYIYKERKTGGRQLRSHSKSGETKEFLIKSYSGRFASQQLLAELNNKINFGII